MGINKHERAGGTSGALSKRKSSESFVEFTRRHSVKELQEMFSE